MWSRRQQQQQHQQRHHHHHHHHHHYHQQQLQLEMQSQNCIRGYGGFHHTQQQENVHLSTVGSNHTTSQHDHQHQQHQQHQQQQHQLQFQHHTRGSNTMDLPSLSSSNPRASRNMAEKQRRDNLNTNISTMASLVPVIVGCPRSNPRASRNMAEKQRRDNLNTNISTMASLVPVIVGCPRRLDKISILRLATSYLRMDYTLGRGSADFLPKQFKDLDVEQYILDNLTGKAGFLIVVTTAGKIVYVSQQVERHLGHAQKELTGQSLYDYVYSEDHDELTKNLTPDEVQPVSTNNLASDCDNSSNSSEISSSSSSTSPKCNLDKITERKSRFSKQRRMFMLRMSQRAVTRREHTQYECLNVTGVLRLADACENPQNRTSTTRRGTPTSNDIIFIGVAWFPKKRPITELSITDANKEEYVTRHLVDGRIIYCDHRISIVAGYMSEEVSGMSAFKYMHKDDVRWTIIGLRQMYDRAEPCGSSCYRLLSKTGQFIYLRTHGYLEYDKDTQSVESFVCVNTLVSEEEGIKFVREMKERFSATVSGFTKAAAMMQNTENLSLNTGLDSKKSNSDATLEDASQLEDAITHLISDLPSPAVSEDRLSPKPMPNVQYAKAALLSQRLPPVSTQTSKIRIKTIDHCLPTTSSVNKNKCSSGRNKDLPNLKQESKNVGMKEEKQMLITQSNDSTVVEKASFSPDGQQKQQRNVGKKKQQPSIDINIVGGSLSPGTSSNMKEIMGHVQAMRLENSNNESINHTNVLLDNDPSETSVVKNNDGNISIVESSGSNDTSESENEISKRRYSSKRISNEENIETGGTTVRTKKRKNEKKYEIASEVRHEQQPPPQQQQPPPPPLPQQPSPQKQEQFELHTLLQQPPSQQQEQFQLQTLQQSPSQQQEQFELHTLLRQQPPSQQQKQFQLLPTPQQREQFELQTLLQQPPSQQQEQFQLQTPQQPPPPPQQQQEQFQLQTPQHSVSYIHCTTFINNENYTNIEAFDNYDHQIHTQPVQFISMDSPIPNIQDYNVEYQELGSSMSFGIPNLVDDEQFEDLLALMDDQILTTTSLDANPDFMLKIFNNLRPVMGFEKNFDEVNSHQGCINNQNIVNDELTKTHLQLANCITIQESQLDVLARDMENSVLQSQRKNLTQLQAEHKIQKQMLKTLQQDHLNIQVNAKQQNIGV
ncbi:hypothetical protein M0802_010976 [Mischocyttarus mexicanus]|nr:hypothetical protein M0802_010976 [Mischocyttarus mexicanus]